MRAFWIVILALLAGTSVVRAQEPLIDGAAAPLLEGRAVPADTRIWGRTEYLLWWIKPDKTPVPLMTTGPAGTPRAGALGQPGSRYLDDDTLDYRQNSGGRFFLGMWLDRAQTVGVEISGFCLETHTLHFQLDSGRDGAPTIARPFFNTLTGQEDAQIISSPGDNPAGKYFGGMDIFGDSRTWGGEVNALTPAWLTSSSRWNLIGGFRYLGQKDQLRFTGSSTILTAGNVGFGGAPAPAPDIVSYRDYLETLNHFYGGQIGAQGFFQFGRLRLDLTSKTGIGSTEQHLSVSGRTLLTDSSGKSQVLPGGLYALPSNIRDFQQYQFSWIAEVGVRLGFQVTRWCRAEAGYSFLYWADVVRPGGQIDRNLDPRQIPSNLAYTPGTFAAPRRLFEATDFWAHGLTLGLAFQY